MAEILNLGGLPSGGARNSFFAPKRRKFNSTLEFCKWLYSFLTLGLASWISAINLGAIALTGNDVSYEFNSKENE